MSTAPRLRSMIGQLFPARERLWLGIVLCSAIVVALFEAMGVASIVPFMAVVMNPSALDAYPALGVATGWVGITDRQDQLVLLGMLTGAMVIASNAASAAGLYLQQRFIARTRVRLTTTLFDGYLRLPFSFHTSRDSASLSKVIYTDAENASRLVGAVVQVVARSFVILALLTLLVLRNPQVAVWTLTALGGSYLLVYKFVRRRQEILGTIVSESATQRHRASQEGLGGVKDLIVLGRADSKAREFRDATREVSYANAKNQLASGLPKFLLEPIAFCGILSVALMLILRGDGNASTAIPTLALYAFVGYRLLPALQQLFVAAVEIRFTLPSLEALQADWQEVRRHQEHDEKAAPAASVDISRTEPLVLERVSFSYAGAATPAVKGVSLELRPGESLGLVGRTGSGKTTLADIILGLYEPQDGVIRIGNTVLNRGTAREWRRHVGYVPQQVFLANASVAENIAFGLPRGAIDHEAVHRAARQAQAEEFVLNLPRGFDTVVGERGVRLSGGQRQRLGIARALYNDPEILVLDEATSALDGMTEDALMNAIYALRGSRSVILIAHRLRTVEACDCIVMMNRGEVVARGRYEELLQTNQEFRTMVGQSASSVVPTLEPQLQSL